MPPSQFVLPIIEPNPVEEKVLDSPSAPPEITADEMSEEILDVSLKHYADLLRAKEVSAMTK